MRLLTRSMLLGTVLAGMVFGSNPVMAMPDELLYNNIHGQYEGLIR